MLLTQNQPSLTESIITIVLGRSYEKMRWVNARRIVAIMKDVKSFWNQSKVKFPRISGCHFFVSSECEFPITARQSRSRPQPAGFCFNNIGPESLINITDLTFSRTVVWTILRPSSINFKILSTGGTFALLHKELTFLFEVSGHSHANASDPCFLRSIQKQNQLKSL